MRDHGELFKLSIPLLPPKTEPIVDDDKFSTLNWLVFFDEIANGDAGTTWVPTFTGLTEVGTAIKSGVFYRISKKLIYFRIVITPGTNTSATLGTTYCNNFPLTFTSDGATATCSSYTVAMAGITASNKRIYTASWSVITTPITIVGIAEAS